MTKLTEELNADYVMGIITENVLIEDLLKTLEDKGSELGKKIDTLAELEGESTRQGDLWILHTCPMTQAVDEIKARHGGQFPAHFKDVMEAFKAKYPGRGAILHPLCILHQVVRTTYGAAQGKYFEEIACRSIDTGEIAVAQDGLVMSGLSEEEAKAMVEGAACLYYLG